MRRDRVAAMTTWGDRQSDDWIVSGPAKAGAANLYEPAHGPAYQADHEWARKIETDLDTVLSELDRDIDAATPSGIYYCGCGTCLVREVLAFTIPRVLAAVRDGLVTIEGEGK
jgi:hypothetical protein